MSLWSSLRLDKPATGTHYSSRMRAILGACSAMALIRIDRVSGTRHALVTAGEIVAPAGGFVERYGLRVHPSALSRVLGMARVFASALNVASVSVEQQGGVVWVVVPLQRPAAIPFEAAWALAPHMPKSHVLLGVSDNGAQLTLDTDANTHVGVIGQTRSGKSTLMQTMALSALLLGRQVALLDPSDGVAPLSGHPRIWRSGRFTAPNEIAACLRYLADTVLHNENMGDLVVFLDEGKVLCDRADIRAALAVLTQMGRHSGVHMIVGMQTSTGFGAAIWNNLVARLVGRMATAQYAGMAGAPGAERLHTGCFLANTVLSDRVEFQAAMPSTAELSRLCPYPPRGGVVPDMPDGQQFTPNAPAPASRGAIVASAIGDPGRTPDDLPPHVRHAIVTHWRQHARPLPRRRMAALVNEQDIDNDKRDRWLTESLGERWRR